MTPNVELILRSADVIEKVFDRSWVMGHWWYRVDGCGCAAGNCIAARIWPECELKEQPGGTAGHLHPYHRPTGAWDCDAIGRQLGIPRMTAENCFTRIGYQDGDWPPTQAEVARRLRALVAVERKEPA